MEEGRITLPKKPEGQQTAIGAVLDDVLRQEAGKRLLGVILLSDGAQRAYAPRDLPPQTAAARLKHLGYPLFTFPVRPIARAGPGPRRGGKGSDRQSRRVREKRIGHQRADPRRRLRQPRNPRARALRNLARQNGSRRRTDHPSRRRRPILARPISATFRKCPANSSLRWKSPTSRASW